MTNSFQNGREPVIPSQKASVLPSLLRRILAFLAIRPSSPPQLQPIPIRVRSQSRKNQRGNVFAMLFAAVALTGVLAAVGMQTLTGPVTTITRVTQKNIAETNMMMNLRIIANAVPLGANDGDPDSDGTKEAAPWPVIGGGETPPGNGGFLPTDLGLTLTDPWGTKYGYCVWDHGAVHNGTRMIGGDDGAGDTLIGTQPLIGIISAGSDKTFQTSCPTYNGASTTPMSLVKASGSDDLILEFTYDGSEAAAGGLWTLNSSDNTQAELRNSAGDAVNVSVNRDTGIGNFLGVTVDTLAAKDKVVAMEGGLMLDDNVADVDCVAGTAGAVRYKAGDKKIEFCDGAGWVPVGGDLWETDGTDIWRDTGMVGIGNANPAAVLDVTGDAKISTTLDVHGAVTLDNILGVAGNVSVNTDKFTIDATSGNTSVAGTLSADGDFDVNGKFTVAATTGNTHADGTLDVDGDTTLGGELDVTGATVLNDTLNVTKAAILSDTLDVTEATTLGDTLDVDGATTLNDTLSVAKTMAVDTDTLFVDATTDKVGIGTLTPSAALEVLGGVKISTHTDGCAAGGANNGTIQYDNGIKKMQICVDGNWNNVSSIDKLDDIGDVYIQEAGTPNNNDILAWNASDERWEAKNVNMVGPTQVTPAGADGSIQFKDGSDLGADAAHLHWDDTNDYLGIGTNAPTTFLTVHGSTAAALMDMRNTNSSGFSGAELQKSGGTWGAFFGYQESTDHMRYNVNTGSHRFFTNSVERMRITQAGDVGIGVSIPAAKLDVAGGIKLGDQATCDVNGANNGTLRFNTSQLEICLDGAWTSFAADGGSGFATGAPDAIDCGSNSYKRLLYLQTANASQWRYSFSGADAGIGIMVTFDATDGSHIATDNTAGWPNATGCDGKNVATLESENRTFKLVGGGAGSGAAALADLSDVDLTTGLASGKVLGWNGTKWVPETGGGGGGTPAGNDREVQFNDGGTAFGSSSTFKLMADGDLLLTGTYTGTASAPASGAGTRMFFDTQSSSFRAGTVSGTQWDSPGNHSMAFGSDTIASGAYSTAFGSGTTASGDYATAMGVNTGATGKYATAIGYGSTASGWYSAVIGADSSSIGVKSISLGQNTVSKGTASFAGGHHVTASGIDSVALGAYAIAGDDTSGSGKGDGSLAIGLVDNAVTISTKPRVTGIQSMGVFMGDQNGRVLSTDNQVSFLGGKMVIDPAAPATNLVADTALEVTGTVKIGSGGESCDADRLGALQYVTTPSAKFQMCVTAGSWTDIGGGGGGGGSGDVTGPASSTDNALVRFDGTGGKTLQDSSAILDDSGNLFLTGNIGIGASSTSYGLQLGSSGSARKAVIAASTGVSDYHLTAEHSVGTSYAGGLNVITNGGDTNGGIHVGMFGTANNKNYYSIIGMRRPNSTWSTTINAVTSGTYLPGIGFAGQTTTSSGSGMTMGASIVGLVDGAVSANTLPSALVFHTSATNAAGLTERMRIGSNGSVSIGSAAAADASAILDLTSTSKGLLPPRMTNAEMTGISSPVAGLMVYDSTNNELNVRTNSAWVALGAGGGGITALTGDVTASGTGSVAATIGDGKVTNAKLANMAANTIKGNNTGSAAAALDLTMAQVRTMLGSGTQSASTYLRGDGTWATVSAGGTPAGSTGQIQFNSGSSTFAADSNLFWDNSAKRLGIGVAAPEDSLHVNGNIQAGNQSGMYATLGGNDLSFHRDGGASYISNLGTGGMSFRTGGSNIRMTIDGSGKVGIGTASPGEALEVNGNIKTTPARSLPNLVLQSQGNVSGNDNWLDQGAYISIGEGGALASASMHMTYIGNGTGYTGAGAVTNGIPAGGYWRYSYNTKSIFADSDVTATSFSGTGTGLTDLNATELKSGTVSPARLGSGTASGSTVLYGNNTWGTIPSSADNLGNHTATTTLNMNSKAITGATNVTMSGNLTLSGTNSAVISDSTADAVLIYGGTTNTNGAGLQLYGSTYSGQPGNAYLNFGGSATAANTTIRYYNGSAWTNALVVASTGVVTASGGFSGAGGSLTGLNATQLTTGTVPVARLSGSYTGIVGTGALNAGSITSGFGNINIGTATFTGNGSGLTSLDASDLSSGTVPSARISGSYTGITGVGALDAGSITSNFGNINIGTATFTGNGSGLSSLNASNLSSGTVPNARISGAYSGFSNITASGDISATGRITSNDGFTASKSGDGAQVLRLNMERNWCFYQRGTGTDSNLSIEADCGGTNYKDLWLVVEDFYIGGPYGTEKLRFNAVNGNLTIQGTASKPGGGSWAATSDIRLKDIDGDYTQGLDSIVKLKPVMFHYKKDNVRHEPSDTQYYGLIAQDVMKVFPEAVSKGDDGYYSLDATPINYALINAVQDLKHEKDADVQALKAGNDGLRSLVENLKKIVDDIIGKIAQLFDMVDLLKAENSALKTDNAALKAEVETLKSQNATILQRLDALEGK